jgi:excisionase family DNA binding protein
MRSKQSKPKLQLVPRSAADSHIAPVDGRKTEAETGVVVIDGRASRELMLRIAHGALRSGIEFLQAQLGARPTPVVRRPLELANPDPERDVITADEVATFLGVDRNTVYDYAGRGVIPHQRLGKRILFRRGALVSWLDASCKATSTRKG